MKKVTLLFGAGAAIPWEAPPTSKITEAIRNSTDHTVDEKTLGNWIHTLLLDNSNSIPNGINFETYVDFIESICTYLLSTDAAHPKLNNSFYKLFELRNEIKEGIENLKCSNGNSFGSNSDKTIHTFYSLIRIIENQLFSYLNNYEKDDFKKLNEKLRQFCEYFITADFIVRTYTLNYDRSIPLVFETTSSKYEFFDGFDIKNDISYSAENDTYLLNKTRILNDKQCHSFYNLHGSCHWSFQETNYKYPHSRFTLKSTKGYKYYPSLGNEGKLIQCNPNESLLSSQIITGYKKSQRIALEPFNYFFDSFFNDIQQSEIIIIVGYSFSDPHINQLIKTALTDNKWVYIIDYRKDIIDGNILRFIGYPLSMPNVFERYSPDIFWSKNISLNSEIYINGFEAFLSNSEWLRIQTT